jgi:hypothetical protein
LLHEDEDSWCCAGAGVPWVGFMLPIFRFFIGNVFWACSNFLFKFRILLYKGILRINLEKKRNILCIKCVLVLSINIYINASATHCILQCLSMYYSEMEMSVNNSLLKFAKFKMSCFKVSVLYVHFEVTQFEAWSIVNFSRVVLVFHILYKVIRGHEQCTTKTKKLKNK